MRDIAADILAAAYFQLGYRIMQLQSQYLADGVRRTLILADRDITVVLGKGDGCTLQLDEAATAIWLPIRGRLTLSISSTKFNAALTQLLPGEMQISECTKGTCAIGHGGALWVALIGTSVAWRRILNMHPHVAPIPVLIPATHFAEHSLRRLAIQLARVAGRESDPIATYALMDAVLRIQTRLSEMIQRCPGRTESSRYQVFLRLQRTRNFLASHYRHPLSNGQLAGIANYHPSHYLRLFHSVYQETPHSYLLSCRLRHAHSLVCNTQLGITEIAALSGFVNRTAFARLFRRHFGTSALKARKHTFTSNRVSSIALHAGRPMERMYA